MMAEQLRGRTKGTALSVVQLLRKLSKSTESMIISRQLIRSATSVACNYRAATRSRSKAEFISKLSIVVEECDETLFWMELINEAGIYQGEDLDALTKEVTELVKIFSSSRRTAKANEITRSPDQ